MTLSFPNPSRFFDAQKGCVRFIGHDGMTSVPFAVEVEALRDGGGGNPVGEYQVLAAFDAARQSVHKVAQDAYANAKQTTYFLTARDFG